MKKALRILFIVLITIIICGVILITYLTMTDYNPELELALDIKNNRETLVTNTLSVMTWNIGYGGLGSKDDYFLDGGKNVNTTQENATAYFEGITDFIENTEADYYLFQELDVNAKRSYHKNQYETLSNVLSDYSTSFAWNYRVDYVPYPWPTIGEVNAGIAAFSSSQIKTSTRIGFDANYDWPVRIIHLDRCLMITTHDIEGSDKQLVIINLHLSAYDDSGSLRTVQLKRLKEIMDEQYALGNYVIAGGDFNQTFSTANNDAYPVLYPDIYLPNEIPSDWLGEGWNYGFDDTAPTYRLLNEPYDPNTNQFGVIDGFITSPNIEIIDVETIDLQFAYSDHQPVKIKIQLK